jgi:hypothetical protein
VKLRHALSLAAVGGVVACGPLIGLNPPSLDPIDADVGDPIDADVGVDADAASITVGCVTFTFLTRETRMNEIAVGPGGAVWGIARPDPDAATTDGPVCRLVSDRWVPQTGSGTKIAVAPDTGVPYVVDAAGRVLRLDGSEWTVVSTTPAMTALAVGSNGALWAIGSAPWEIGSPDYPPYEWVNGTWLKRPMGARKITVAPDTGVAWVANTGGIVSYYDDASDAWFPTNGVNHLWLMSEVAAGPAKGVWGIGMLPWAPGSPDLGIFYSTDGRRWHNPSGGGVRIAVSPEGVPWMLNSFGETFSSRPGTDCNY